MSPYQVGTHTAVSNAPRHRLLDFLLNFLLEVAFDLSFEGLSTQVDIRTFHEHAGQRGSCRDVASICAAAIGT
eukprot:scaffold65038_cov65-Phaeocystis_antarctica.AAC.4